MADARTIPGWYGKLPTLGDFASRRLDAAFIEPWDLWLGEGMSAQREQLGEAWLDAYLGSAVWRFVLMPGAMPALADRVARAGVLMPSVDRVGRYFPLTVVTTLPQLPGSTAELESLLGWLHRLEDLAVDAMHEDWTIEALDAALEALPPPLAAQSLPEHLADARRALADAMAGAGGFVDVASVRSRSDLAALLVDSLGGRQGAVPAGEGLAFWLADNPTAPRMLVSRGLPGRDQTVSMLGADGREPGGQTIF
jgi:type VI secretion system protein ImpM